MNKEDTYLDSENVASPVYGKSVTITLGAHNRPSSNDVDRMFNIGGLIKIAKKKRVWMEIQKISNPTRFETTISTVAVYRPAPKSKLLNKTPFSKMKMKIIPL